MSPRRKYPKGFVSAEELVGKECTEFDEDLLKYEARMSRRHSHYSLSMTEPSREPKRKPLTGKALEAYMRGLNSLQ